jgi:hypothetical protein
VKVEQLLVRSRGSVSLTVAGKQAPQVAHQLLLPPFRYWRRRFVTGRGTIGGDHADENGRGDRLHTPEEGTMKEARDYQRAVRTRRHVVEAVFWAAVAAAVSGTLAIQSRTIDTPVHRVPVDCATGQLLDVLRNGSGDTSGCFVELP